MQTTEPVERATFRHMEESTARDWAIIDKADVVFNKELPNRIIDHLKLLKNNSGGYPVDRLTHSLQTATLAQQDGRDEEYVVCALVHDIGDTLSPLNHADIAAAIVKPYVSEKNHWMVKHHTIFQGYYYFHFYGEDRNLRDKYKDEPFFQYTMDFVTKYDNPAFDPQAEHLPLSFFEPMVHRIFSK